MHGAYRLQEVLVVHNDFVIIDFESDPARPLAERRAKQSALRDVAGLLWSLALARHTALHLGAHTDAELARREPLAARWLDGVRAAFLDAYAAAAVQAGLYPDADGFAAERPLLELFELGRALHDLHDELARRPDTALGALAGLAALITPAAP